MPVSEEAWRTDDQRRQSQGRDESVVVRVREVLAFEDRMDRVGEVVEDKVAKQRAEEVRHPAWDELDILATQRGMMLDILAETEGWNG